MSEWGKPTINMVMFAKSISETLGIELPDFNFDSYREFISDNKDLFNKKNESKLQITTPELGENVITFLEENCLRKSGIYCFLEGNEIVYIGKSINLAERIQTSFTERKEHANIDRIMYYEVPKTDLSIMEMLLIAENNPRLNRDGKTNGKPQRFKSGIDIIKDFVDVGFCVVMKEGD